MSAETVPIHIDGASRGNPGASAFAFVIAPSGLPAVEEHGKLPDTTNNVAEYTALLRALERAAELRFENLHVHSDSELLVKQMNGEYRVKNADLKELYDQAQGLLRRFRSVAITHVRREQNKRADELCNICLDGVKPKVRERSEPTNAAVDTDAVRDDCIACLRGAQSAWSNRVPNAPTAEQIWDQLWSVLEEGGLLKKAKKGRG